MKHISNVRGNAMHYIALAALLAASLLPALLPNKVVAAQLTSRSIQLSSSLVDDTGVNYTVDFTLGTTGNVGGVVIDFCQNNPIVGDSCTAVTGMDIDSATLSDDFTGTFSKDATNSDTDTLVYTNGTPASESGGHQITLNGVTNPSSGPFYARILTYATEADAQGYSDIAPGSNVDEGGVALDLADQVTVTAKVHETLSFNVTTLLGSNTTVTLGDANGVLVDPGTVYDSSTQNAEGGGGNDNAQFSLATNAQSGAIVRLSGDTLTDGGNNIDAGGALAAFTGSSSTEEFGLHVDTTGSTNITADADYDGSGGNYALVNTGGGQDDITQAGGAEIANTAGAPTDTDTAEVEFAAQASNTTPAGVYTGTYTFIATGTF